MIYAEPGKMRYDIDVFEVAPGETIALTLINPDDLMHNLLVLKPQADGGMALAQKAWTMPDAQEKQYLPDDPAILFATNLLQPEQEETLTFKAPESEGDYPYICSFPGHWMSMRGMMRVTKDVSGLRDVRYAFYDGMAKKMPEFEELTPDQEGTAPGGRLIDMAPFRGKGDFSVRFKGTLIVPEDGDYTFYQQSDGGSRVSVDGKMLINRGMKAGDAAAEVFSKTVNLTKGEHQLTYDYYDFDKDEQVLLAWEGPGVPKTFISRQRKIDVSEPIVLEVKDMARVDRVVLPDAPPKSVAVGLPSGVHYVVDPLSGRILYTWEGRYLDVAPDRVHRGGRECFVLGERVPADVYLADPEGAVPKDLAFRGYTRKPGEAPAFLYELGDRELTLEVEPAEGQLVARYRFADGKRSLQIHAPDKTVRELPDGYEVDLQPLPQN